ncbi:MAG: pseudouridine synthase [bacterium]|nr:pseudouridine synthase [bacterium]
MRLNKFLATAGIASRRGADEIIKLGQVKVNGKVVKEMGVKVDVDKDVVTVDGKKVELEPKIVTYLLNKPRGVISTADDPEHRKTVLDLVPKTPRVFPCGRLDENTMGLVILTNDGNLCYQLTHPKFEHKKEYIVHGRSKTPEAALEIIRRGVRLVDGPIKVDALEVIRVSHQKVEFKVTIHEGRNHLVRRLCAAVGIELDSLTRIRVGDYELGDLAPGKYKTVQ